MLHLLEVRRRACIVDIAHALQVSEATVRRDVAELEEQGVVTRSWGAVELAGTADDPFQEAFARQGQGKERIAHAAATLVQPGQTVILDIGTTVHHLALALQDIPLTVVTPSLAAFEVFRNQPNSSVVLLGGRWSEPYQCFEGDPVVDALARQQADIAFLGCSGVGDTGRIRDTSYAQAAMKRAMHAAASRTYLLADAQKFPGQGNSAPFGLAVVDGLITDLDPLPEKLAEQVAAIDLEVIHA